MIQIFYIGIIAACCTSLAFIPQALKTIRTKDTSGISLQMYGLFTFGTFMWLVYGIALHNVPVMAANAVTLLFALVILVYKLRYK
jgi:MtN3 and saliva related transmembrane protein